MAMLLQAFALALATATLVPGWPYRLVFYSLIFAPRDWIIRVNDYRPLLLLGGRIIIAGQIALLNHRLNTKDGTASQERARRALSLTLSVTTLVETTLFFLLTALIDLRLIADTVLMRWCLGAFILAEFTFQTGAVMRWDRANEKVKER